MLSPLQLPARTMRSEVPPVTVERISVDLGVGRFAWWEIQTAGDARPDKTFSVERRILKKRGAHMKYSQPFHHDFHASAEVPSPPAWNVPSIC